MKRKYQLRQKLDYVVDAEQYFYYDNLDPIMQLGFMQLDKYFSVKKGEFISYNGHNFTLFTEQSFKTLYKEVKVTWYS